MNETHISLIISRLNLSTRSVKNTVALLQEGATVPFIARYRKEATGSLDEVAIMDIKKMLTALEALDKRKEAILKSIEEQDKLTPKLRKQIEDCFDLNKLEDIYLPYKRKRKTRASVAREKGLEPLAQQIFDQHNQSVGKYANNFVNDEVPTMDDALQGARDIIAEWINEDSGARELCRNIFKEHAIITTKLVKGKEKEGANYKDYFDYSEPLKKAVSHRVLALRRAEEEGIIRLSIAPDAEQTVYQLSPMFLAGNGAATNNVREALEDSYKRLLAPSIENEFKNSSKEKADIEAINVFAENLKQLLMAAPLGEKRVLALDPGFRTGCKVVCLDESGALLGNTTIFPHPPQSQQYEAADIIKKLVKKHKIEAIAIGNGTAGRESDDFISSIPFDKPIETYMVNENGASIYSASENARKEFPDQDITVRGAVSIGRRLMDPLAELVKIDPKSIGVGQYQHDVHQGKLKESLTTVVESSVNSVGININTASKHLLTYISGLGPVLADNVIAYRNENGQFTSIAQVKKVKRMGAKAFEQCAGFLRIREAKNPLDNTAVHPERYKLVKKMAADHNCKVIDLIKDKEKRKALNLKNYITDDVGMPTLNDIVKELEKPGLDPRGKAKNFSFANEIKEFKDVKEGMILPGIVNNITNFGVFVDIGIKEGGMVHISQLANRFVSNPSEVVHLTQQVQVKVMEVDRDRKRIKLSMKEV